MAFCGASSSVPGAPAGGACGRRGALRGRRFDGPPALGLPPPVARGGGHTQLGGPGEGVPAGDPGGQRIGAERDHGGDVALRGLQLRAFVVSKEAFST